MKIINIGRLKTNDIILTQAKDSREHAKIILSKDGVFSLEDTSTHGTHVNGKKIRKKECRLQLSDVVKINGKLINWKSHFEEQSKPEPEIIDIEEKIYGSESIDYDFSDSFINKLQQFKKDSLQSIESLIKAHETNPSIKQNDILAFTDYELAYNKLNQKLVSVINELEQKTKSITNEYQDNLVVLSKHLKTKIVYLENKWIQTEKKLTEEHKSKGGNNHSTIEQSIERVRVQYRNQTEELKTKVSNRQQQLNTIYNELVDNIRTTLALIEPNKYIEAYFNSIYDTVNANSDKWEEIESDKRTAFKKFQIGKQKDIVDIFYSQFTITKRLFVPFANNQNVIVKYNSKTDEETRLFVNNLLYRSLAIMPPTTCKITIFDSQQLEGTSSVLKQLNSRVFSLETLENNIGKCLETLYKHMEDVIGNLLKGEITTLEDYNKDKVTIEPYHIIVYKGFPAGLDNRSISIMKSIFNNGIKAGVTSVIMVNEDADIESNYRHGENPFEFIEEQELTNTFNFTSKEFPYKIKSNTKLHFDSLSFKQENHIVNYINKGFENQISAILPFEDYMINKKSWHTYNSVNAIHVPFGLSSDMIEQSVKITQEIGQNAALVIGIPGSGKSVFLHTLITNAAIKYSPNELELYLVDFSGVEFNIYAKYNLPHAKVIAPESEREFGLSVLKRLQDEGMRRMELCRKASVTNIVDYRAKVANADMPRILVIVDEFQKFFEIENDDISKEAEGIIEIIIREFRKFGINIILATQTLRHNPLKMEMIANRIVFKCALSDISIMLPEQKTIPEIEFAGECIYNDNSGASYSSKKVKTFFINNDVHTNTLSQLNKSDNIAKVNTLVFRSAALALLENNDSFIQTQITKNPEYTRIWLGEPIAIAEHHVHANITSESGNNVLIIGGEKDIAERIALNCSHSIIKAYAPDNASVALCNFMRKDNKYISEADSLFQAIPHTKVMLYDNELNSGLSDIKTMIDERIENVNNEVFEHTYLIMVATQLSRKLKPVMDGNYEDSSAEAETLQYILKNGASLGIFVILQIDNSDNFKRMVGNNILQCFNHRIALQMNESASMDIIGSYTANKIYNMKSPASKNRAYYYNPETNALNKFKPYELYKDYGTGN